MHIAVVSPTKPEVVGSTPFILSTGFSRSDGPLVSVLIPVTDITKTVATIRSVYSSAFLQNRIQCVLQCVHEQKKIIDFISNMVLPTPHKFLLCELDQLYTYESMAKDATGDWLLPLNEGSKILTSGWDEILDKTFIMSTTGHMLDSICLLATDHFDFMFIRRDVFKVLNKMSLNRNNEDWICDLLYSVDSVFSTTIKIDFLDEFVSYINGSTGVDRMKDEKKLLNYIGINCKDLIHPNGVKLWANCIGENH